MTLYIRTVATVTTGLGHLTRTLAVAEAASANGVDVAFVLAPDSLGAERVRATGHTVVEHAHWTELLLGGDAVVFDDYGLERAEVDAAVAAGAVTALVDDLRRTDLGVQLVVAPGEAEGAAYTSLDAVLLLGPSYALVRRAFVARRRLRSHPDPAPLLLTFGGGGHRAATATALGALEDQPALRPVTLLEGPAAQLSDSGPAWLRRVRDPDDVAAVFDEAGAAVSGAGSTCWELLAMGMPTALVELVDNQRGIHRIATSSDAVLDAGRVDAVGSTLPSVLATLADQGERHRLSQAALDLVDGRGAERVVEALLSLSR